MGASIVFDSLEGCRNGCIDFGQIIPFFNLHLASCARSLGLCPTVQLQFDFMVMDGYEIGWFVASMDVSTPISFFNVQGDG